MRRSSEKFWKYYFNKLQKKYNSLKKKWLDIKYRSKEGSEIAPDESSLWYYLLDQVLSDTNTNLKDVSCPDPADASYVQENYYDETADGDCNIFDDKEKETDKETNTPVPDKRVRESCGRNVWWKFIRKIVRSQTQALSQLAGSLNQLVKSHGKCQKEQMNFEKERGKAFLEF